MDGTRPALDLSSLRAWIEERLSAWVAALEELVRSESPSGEAALVGDCLLVAERLLTSTAGLTSSGVGMVAGVPCLRLRLGAPGQGGPLLLGHLDTVWGVGSFQPLFRAAEGKALGPGVFDMKGGLVVALAALAGLQERGQPRGGVTLLLNGDEEVGSAASRALIEAEARSSSAVLVLEPPLGQAIKVARKGVGGYRLTVKGRAAHAGLDPERGINALIGLAPLVEQVAALARPELGTTVSPTRMRGGTRTNVIPAEASLEVDVRFSAAAEAERVDDELRQLQSRLPGAELEILGGVNRPPFEASASRPLFELAERVWAELSPTPLEGLSVGGGSDGNFTAALGVPTLDGLGIVGGNAHAEGEWALLSSIPERAALLAGCIAALWEAG